MKKRILLALLAIGALLCLFTPTAGAVTQSGGDRYYGPVSGQCANWSGEIYDTPSTTILTAATTATTGNCTTQLPLSPGSVDARIQLQVWNGSAFVNWGSTKTVYNAGAAGYAIVTATWACLPSGTFRVVTGHNAWVNGANRSYLWASPGVAHWQSEWNCYTIIP